MKGTATYQAAGGWPALPVIILVLSFAFPPEVSISLGSLRLSPYRITLIVMLVPALNLLLQNRRTPAGLIDSLMAAHGLWAALSLILAMGVAEGVESGGIYFIETFGAYLLARAYVRTYEDFVAVARLVFTVSVSLLAFAAVESFSGMHILREPFKAVFGGAGPHVIEPRLGLTRAFTSFEHPILFGVFSASAFACAYFILGEALLNNKSIKRLAAVALATFFSLSGGPFTALALQMGLIGWDRLTKGITNRWSILMGIIAAAWLVLTLLSNRSPILVFISYLTFSANSAYNRVHIWNYGTAEVGRHPMFGIGLNDWIRAPWMSSSMDNFWLLTTVRYGLPAFIFLALAVWLVGWKQANGAHFDLPLKNARKAWIITILSFVLAGLTVHFWNALMVHFFFLVGCGMALAKARQHQPVSQPQQTFSIQPRERLSWT